MNLMQNAVPMYAQTNPTSVDEPNGSPGSLLAEIQSMESALSTIEKYLDEHTRQIGTILLPEMKADNSPPVTMPEPMRSDYATRLNSAVRTARTIGLRMDYLSQRVKLT